MIQVHSIPSLLIAFSRKWSVPWLCHTQSLQFCPHERPQVASNLVTKALSQITRVDRFGGISLIHIYQSCRSLFLKAAVNLRCYTVDLVEWLKTFPTIEDRARF